MLAQLYAVDFSVRLSVFGLCNALIVLWARYVMVPAKPGWNRFFLFLPLFALNVFVASLFNFDEPAERVLCFLCLSGYLVIGSFREMALSLNRGQVTKVLDSGSLTAFAVALLLPANVAFEEKPISPSKKTDSEQTAPKKHTVFEDVEFCLIRFEAGSWVKEIGTLFVSLCVKAVMWYSLGVLSQSMEDFSFSQSVVYSYFFYFHLSTIGTTMDFLVLATLNIKCSPAFDSPFIARSMTIFWSQKWNLVVQHMLKEIFFDCLAEGSLVSRPQYYNRPKPGTGRVLCSMLSVFIASAAMHGFFIMKALNTTEFPVLFASYFLVNALVVILEKFMRSVLKRFGVYTRSPTFLLKVLLVLYTQTVVHVLSHLLFWPDVVRLQFMPNLVDGVVQLGNRVVQTFQI